MEGSGMNIDVVVVGGGPGGSAAAKRCAEHGLKTLLLEKRKLPRDKSCSGLQLSILAQKLIKQEFGETPREVLVDPFYLSGFDVHIPGAASVKIEHKMPLAWRKDLDYWMNQKVLDVGGEIWDGARVVNVDEGSDGCTVRVERNGKKQDIKARYVVGADGTTSVVRKSMFPNLEVRSYIAHRECYRGALSLDREYYHIFSTPQLCPHWGAVDYKGDTFLIEGGANDKERAIEMMKCVREMLVRDYGLAPDSELLWRDACIEPMMYSGLFSGSFLPAKGNILLVGNAAGLNVPLTGEGIGTAIESGLLAASSIIRASERVERAEVFYLGEVASIISKLRNFFPLVRKVTEQANGNPESLSKALAEFLRENLNMS
jgi:flavin-dependent dehydrogenase